MLTNKFVKIQIALFFISFTTLFGQAVADAMPPKFQQVYELLRTNLDGVSQTDLDRDAVKGLLAELPGQAMLVTGPATNAEQTPAAVLSKTSLFDGAYAYFRIGKVEGNLGEKLRAAYEDILQTNKSKIKGVILDLRFSGGADYQAAAAAADCFLNSEQPLLAWGTGSAHATTKTNAITAPLAILVNSQTTGAAEALAAALRESSTGLILGSTTAGQANVFKDFDLDNGEKLRIATSQIKLGDGTALARGLKPDITVDCNLADEKMYLENPYMSLHSAAVAQNAGAANAAQMPRRPTNEAELVRERRAEESDDSEASGQIDQPAAVPVRPVIADPVMARALDLLKGIAVLQESHPG